MKRIFSGVGVRVQSGGSARTAPWYIDVFLAIGGWFAGLLAAVAVFAFGFALFASGGVEVAWIALFIGLAFVAAGLAIGRGSAFRRHFAVAIAGAGLTAFSGGLAWILTKIVGDSSRAFGASLLITSAAQAILAAFAGRRLDDRILTFLATLGWFGLAGAGVALFFGRDADPNAAPFAILAALCGAAGAIVFIAAAPMRAPALGAALLVAPILAGEAVRPMFGVVGASVGALRFAPDAIYAAAILVCLFRLKGKAAPIALIAAGALLLAFVWLLPHSGAAAALLLVAGMAAGSRALAALGVVALASFVGRYYYDLSLPLLQKSALLGGLGAATIALAEGFRRFGRTRASAMTQSARGPGRSVMAVVAFGALLAGSALLVNRQVAALEREFREARTIYFALAPVDPRSILQGDYMTLGFDDSLFPPEETKLDRRGEIFLTLDERYVARFSRLASAGDVPKADEIRIDYAYDGGRPRYCPETFFFQEGEAEIFNAARFAAVLVAADGKTRLVALADKDLKIIDPKATPKR
jgi:uncharacterized membrane-anchored protein